MPKCRSIRFRVVLTAISTTVLLLIVVVALCLLYRQGITPAVAQQAAEYTLSPIYAEVTPSRLSDETSIPPDPFVRRSDGKLGIGILALEEALSAKLPATVLRLPIGWETPLLWEIQSKLSSENHSFSVKLRYYSQHYWESLNRNEFVNGRPPTSRSKAQVFLGRYAALEFSKLGLKPESLVGKTIDLTLAMPTEQSSTSDADYPKRFITIPAEVTGVACRELDKADKNGRLNSAYESGAPFDAGWISDSVVNLKWLEAVAAEAKVTPVESIFVYSLPFVFRDSPTARGGAFAKLSRYDERRTFLQEYYSTGKLPLQVENLIHPLAYKIKTTQMNETDVAELLTILRGLGLSAQAVYPKTDPYKALKQLLDSSSQ